MSGDILDVLIGGAGIAASAAAIRLCDLGLRPLLVVVAGRGIAGIEAIPESALPLVSDLGLSGALRTAGAELVEGFENHWFENAPVTLPGRWIHVDRVRFAGAALREAIVRGARVRWLDALPVLRMTSNDVTCDVDGCERRFGCAIDATGRSAIWSRPLHRDESSVADLFDFPEHTDRRGRIARVSNESGARGADPRSLGVGPQAVSKASARTTWAYRIGARHRVSAGIVSIGGQNWKSGRSDIWDALGLPAEESIWCGRRAAAHQWCASPVEGRRIAIGDAAHAYAPIAGQGIRFALASARAAAALVHTWRVSPESSTQASRFYDDFIRHSYRRHRRWLDLMSADQPSSPDQLALPELVMCAAPVGSVGLSVDSRIVSGSAVQLPDGEYARWVGGIDVLEIRDLAVSPVPTSSLIEALVARRYTPEHADAVVRWCVKHEVLRKANIDEP